MPGDLLSRPLIEIAADLREKRVTARELIEAAIFRHERFGERLRLFAVGAGAGPGRGLGSREQRRRARIGGAASCNE